MKRLLFVLLIASGLTACAHHYSAKVTIDVSDRTAYAALRTFDAAEEALYHQKTAWPTVAQHEAISAQISKAYQAVVDVANIGLLLPPGGQLSTADLSKIGALEKNIADLAGLISPTAGAAIQDAYATFKTQASALIAAVKGL
jgi:hypothetical protein